MTDLLIYSLKIKYLQISPTILNLNCNDNKIRSVNNIPNIELLLCMSNRIKKIPILLKIREAYFTYNKIKDYSNNKNECYIKNKYLKLIFA